MDIKDIKMNTIRKIAKFLGEATDPELRMKLMTFFKENPEASDSSVHAFAEKEGIDPHKFEEHIYVILGSFFGAGFAKEKGFTEEDADPEQLKMGIKVEMEHTTDPLIAKRISLDHLSEIKDYYTRLAKMEAEAEG
jgi:hypothetical protein